MFRFHWCFTLTIRQVCNFTLRNISKKRKKNENIFLTYMSISHSLTPRLALVDIHISSSCSCRMSSVAHTVVTIYVCILYTPENCEFPSALCYRLLHFTVQQIFCFIITLVMCVFSPPLSLVAGLSTQPTGSSGGDCAPDAPAKSLEHPDNVNVCQTGRNNICSYYK